MVFSVIRNKIVITAASYVAMFFLGVSIQIVGAAARNIGLSAYEIGLLVSAQNVGFVFGVVIAGSLADTRSKPRILLGASVVLAASYFAFYRQPGLAVNLAIMVAMGLGIGAYEAVTDAMLLEVHASNESLHINVNHFFVTFGSLIVTAYLIFLQMGWRASMVQSAAGAAALAVLFALIFLPARPRAHTSLGERLRLFVGEKAFVATFLLTILVLGAAQTSQSVMTTFLMELRGFSQVTSKISLVVLLAGVGVGRLVVGYLTRAGNLYPYLLASCALSAVTNGLFYFVPLRSFAFAVIFLQGVTQAALLPLLITLAGLLYRKVSGTAMGVLKLAIPLGGIAVPLLFSALSRIAPLAAAVAVFPLAFAVAFVFALASRRLLQTQATR
jgi:predicted MFS family arabinose efflux permease